MASNKKIGNMFAFLGLVVLVGLSVLRYVTGLLSIDLGVVATILQWVKEVAIILAIGIGAYEFTASKNKTYRIIFWVAIVLYVVLKFI